jgi:hypothetical protein
MNDHDNGEPGTKHHLDMKLGDVQEDDSQNMCRGKEHLDDMLTDGGLAAKEVPIAKIQNERKKRSKKVGADSTSLGSLGSCEDPVQAQLKILFWNCQGLGNHSKFKCYWTSEGVVTSR